MRTNQARKTGPALLDPLEQLKPVRPSEEIRRAPSAPLRPRREGTVASSSALAQDTDSNDYASIRRHRRIRRGLIPQTRNGLLIAGVVLASALAAVAAAFFAGKRYVHRDPHFVLASSASIELHGNAHLSGSQLLSVFGEDIDGNIFDVPLAQRREQLQRMPWVERATVMRLLPNHLRVDVVERTPVAFVRQGGSIGMTDAHGVLLDIPPDAPGNPSYSFPVVTGLKADDTAESRGQRMRLYAALLKDLDSDGKKVSAELSEVDLSDPEDVKALLPSGNTETLVHFGTEHFLDRYKRFQEHIGDWRAQYPRLTSVDMRYERQVVLQMPPKDSTVAQAPTAEAPPAANAGAHHPPPKPAVKPRLIASAAKPTVASGPKPAGAKPSQAAQTVTPTSPASVASSSVSSRPTSGPTASPTSAMAPVSQPPGSHAAAVKHPAAKPAGKQAEMARRVEAIKAWMAKRQKMRDAQGSHSTETP